MEAFGHFLPNGSNLRFAFDFPTHCTHNPAKHQKPNMAPTLREQVQQSIHDAVYSTFAEACQRAHTYYDDNKLDECIVACTEIINERSVPPFIQISTLVLLALVVESDEDFRATRTRAGT